MNSTSLKLRRTRKLLFGLILLSGLMAEFKSYAGLPIGARCNSGLNCDSTSCINGLCTGLGAGAKCLGYSQCASNNCYQGYCKFESGQKCNRDSECLSNHCNKVPSTATMGTCGAAGTTRS